MTAGVLLPIRATFRAVAETVVPETVTLDTDGWTTLEGVVERGLQGVHVTSCQTMRRGASRRQVRPCGDETPRFPLRI